MPESVPLDRFLIQSDSEAGPMRYANVSILFHWEVLAGSVPAKW